LWKPWLADAIVLHESALWLEALCMGMVRGAMSSIIEKIRRRAHELWEANGRPEGRDHENWIEAERQIMAEEGEGEPARGQPQLAPNERPEPQPEVPADPTGGVEGTRSGGGPEMPADTTPEPEIPAEPGISEIPAAPPGAADVAGKRGRKKTASPKEPATSGDLAGAGAAAAKALKPPTGKGKSNGPQVRDLGGRR
jgi:hypothetical protein